MCILAPMDDAEKIAIALETLKWGAIDGSHHKAWVIDQTVRVLTGCPTVTEYGIGSTSGEKYSYEALGESEEYLDWVAAYRDGEDGPETYSWDEGIAP